MVALLAIRQGTGPQLLKADYGDCLSRGTGRASESEGPTKVLPVVFYVCAPGALGNATKDGTGCF